MSEELRTYYFKQYTGIKTITQKINKPVFFDDKINLCPKMKHEYKPYKDFSKETKDKVKSMLDVVYARAVCPSPTRHHWHSISTLSHQTHWHYYTLCISTTTSGWRDNVK